MLIVVMAVCPLMWGCSEPAEEEGTLPDSQSQETIARDGTYDSKDEVKDYLEEYGELPDNYITKNEARDLGWNGGSVEKYAPGKCIGGDRFGNYEGKLPKASDKDFYHECDIDTLGKDSRGSKRIIYAKDGSIYYTDDHYETFDKIDTE